MTYYAFKSLWDAKRAKLGQYGTRLGFFYCLFFEDRVVKVGQTRCPAGRFAEYYEEPLLVLISSRRTNHLEIEGKVINALSGGARDPETRRREWFQLSHEMARRLIACFESDFTAGALAQLEFFGLMEELTPQLKAA